MKAHAAVLIIEAIVKNINATRPMEVTMVEIVIAGFILLAACAVSAIINDRIHK
jgi:hypothetical protein